MRVLSRLFRRLFLSALEAAFAGGEIQFFSNLTPLKEPKAFKAYLAPLRTSEWVVYAKRPFAGPSQVLAYLARYTHRVAIANSRLLSLSDGKVGFRWKDYRDGKIKVMTLEGGEFIRRFLLHVLPDGFHRIRHYGLFANGSRVENIGRARELLNAPPPEDQALHAADAVADEVLSHPCPCCGGRMIIIETFERGSTPRNHPTASTAAVRIDTS